MYTHGAHIIFAGTVRELVYSQEVRCHEKQLKKARRYLLLIVQEENNIVFVIARTA